LEAFINEKLNFNEAHIAKIKNHQLDILSQIKFQANNEQKFDDF
jgi:hypothetical protein